MVWRKKKEQQQPHIDIYFISASANENSIRCVNFLWKCNMLFTLFFLQTIYVKFTYSVCGSSKLKKVYLICKCVREIIGIAHKEPQLVICVLFLLHQSVYVTYGLVSQMLMSDFNGNWENYREMQILNERSKYTVSRRGQMKRITEFKWRGRKLLKSTVIESANWYVRKFEVFSIFHELFGKFCTRTGFDIIEIGLFKNANNYIWRVSGCDYPHNINDSHGKLNFHCNFDWWPWSGKKCADELVLGAFVFIIIILNSYNLILAHTHTPNVFVKQHSCHRAFEPIYFLFSTLFSLFLCLRETIIIFTLQNICCNLFNFIILWIWTMMKRQQLKYPREQGKKPHLCMWVCACVCNKMCIKEKLMQKWVSN